MKSTVIVGWALSACALLGSAAARAEVTDLGLEPVEPLPPPPAEADSADEPGSEPSRPEPGETLDKAFAHLPDPTLPAPLRVAGTYAASYASTEAAARPLAALAGRSGLVSELGGELGLHSRLSVLGAALLAPPSDEAGSGRAAGRAGMRLSLTNPGARPARVTAAAGYLRDFSEASGPYLEVAATLDVDRVRFGSYIHGEKMIADDRDAVDIYAASGASVRTIDELRIGVEYVGQDFEDAWEDEEVEGGIRHFAGLTFAVAPGDRVSIVGGPAFGLNQSAPRVLGRVALTYLF